MAALLAMSTALLKKSIRGGLSENFTKASRRSKVPLGEISHLHVGPKLLAS